MPSMTRAGYKPEPSKPPKKAPKKKPRRRRGRRNTAAVVSLVIFLIAACVGAATVYVYTQTEPYTAVFCPGTTLSGFPLNGASWENARTLLAQLTEEKVASFVYTLTWGQETYTLTAEDIKLRVDESATLTPLWQVGREGGMLTRWLDMLAAQREPINMEPVITYTMEPVDALLERIRADIECDPVDATVTFVPSSSEPFRYTQESVGLALDTEPLRAQIEQAIMAMTGGETDIAPQVLEPQIYMEELESASVLRARVTMQVADDEDSLRNVTLAAGFLHGVRIAPGAELSFNSVVGRRTAEGGYVSAEEPAYGAGVTGVGGGVCQVSTALYQAALLGGLEVTERSAAVRPVAYCEMGQEAAVSDQGLDLVLCNRTQLPVFVTARVYENGDGAQILEVQLIGEALDARYALASTVEESGLIEEPVYVRDREGLYATYTDERVPVGEAEPGYTAVVERIMLDAQGEEISRETISEDSYEPVPPAVYVGVTERE